MTQFSEPGAAARYLDNPPRLVPGLADLHRMAGLLLAEHVPEDGRVLVVGAGGGMELAAFARAHPGWLFDGVDPSAEMLALARATLGPLEERVQLHTGYVDDAPPGPFDGAACLLTLHFLPPYERRRTLAEIRRRLGPGAPLVVAHHSIPADPPARALWLARFSAFAISSGIAPDVGRRMGETIAAAIPILSPEADEALMREAGFATVDLFYAAFTFRGWVARNP